MPFTVITLGEFLDELSLRLDDTAGTFFSRDELLDYTKETLRTWAAHTGYWVRRASFTTTPGVKDYDLPSLVKYTLAGDDIYPLALDLADRDIINSLCYALLEPPLVNWPAGWPGTAQFTLGLLTDALQFSLNATQQATSLVTTFDTLPISPTPIAQYDLPADNISLRTLYWQVPEGQQYPLARQDQYLQGLLPNDGTIPDSYSVVATSPRRVEVTPAPQDTGLLVYVQVPGHLTLQPTLLPTAIYIPPNFSWAAKWHALFTLLNAEGERRDKFRADYCAMRIKDALVVARNLPGILRAYIDDVQVGVTTSWDEDAIAPNWRNVTGTPLTIVQHSYTTISLSPIPVITSDHPDGKYSVSFDLSANALIPESEASYLDISADLVQCLLDYAHHLACFKLGGQEFADSIPSYTRFLTMAMAFNAKLKAESNNFELLRDKTDYPRQRKPSHIEEPTT